jgi:hypothetical protein
MLKLIGTKEAAKIAAESAVPQKEISIPVNAQCGTRQNKNSKNTSEVNRFDGTFL